LTTGSSGTGLAPVPTAVDFAIHLFILVVFLNRYVFGLYFRLMRGKSFKRRNDNYEPTITVVIPLFNEGPTIYDTIISIIKLDYPPHKLSVTVVDDCSTDDSYAHACRARDEHPDMVTVLKNPYNMGKRRGINYAVREATSEIIVSVDSDVIVHPTALKELIAWFTEPEIAAVGGRVHVSNPNENWLTKLQTIKYYFGQEHMKNLERACETVLCLSGCLTAYRRDALMHIEPILEDRNILGVEIKYGEDRYLTHQLVRHGYKNRQTMDAMCFTKAPPTLRGYFNQQLRWKRSNIVDYFLGLSDVWKLHPLVTLNYLAMMLLVVVYPIIIVTHVLHHQFFALATLHIEVVSLFAIIYYFSPTIRKLPPWLRVNPLAFLPMAVMMPVAYLLLTPLGFWTLDSSSWETRGHAQAQTAPPPPVPPQ
jgi:cellulose synthase/poly-beta-1,6-N-acetylglucosamine synthase-like glycosyltransferase